MSTWRVAFFIGLFEFAGTYIFYTWSLRYLPSGIVGTLTLLTPVFTYLASLVAGIAGLNVRFFAAIFLSVFGAALCLPVEKSFSSFQFTAPVLIGVGFITLSNILFAIGNVFITRLNLKNRWSDEITYQALAFGALISLVVCIFTPHESIERLSHLKVWLLPFYLGIVATGVGFYLWNRGVKKVSATPASLIGNFKAPFSLLWGALLLGEKLSFQIFAGLALLILATQVLPPQTGLKPRFKNYE
jgi:drug/metabolite transporter (DMT)-like permease